MMTISQAKRLKEAGWDFDVWILQAIDNGTCPAFPTEKEMMKFLKEKLIAVCPLSDGDGWLVSLFVDQRIVSLQHADLTEALVQACEAVLKQKEAK